MSLYSPEPGGGGQWAAVLAALEMLRSPVTCTVSVRAAGREVHGLGVGVAGASALEVREGLSEVTLRAESCGGASLRKRVCQEPLRGWAELSRGLWGCPGQARQHRGASQHIKDTLVSSRVAKAGRRAVGPGPRAPR